MKLSHDKKLIFKHAFMAGLDLAGTITRSEVDETLKGAMKRFEMCYKRRFGEKARLAIDMMANNGSVRTSELEPYFDNIDSVKNTMYELKRKGIVRKVGACKWELNNIELVG